MANILASVLHQVLQLHAGGNQDDIVIFGGNSSWQPAGVLPLGKPGGWSARHRVMRGCGTDQACGGVRVADTLASVLHQVLQMHAGETKMTSSFSAAAAAGSVLACFSSVIRVAGARGVARYEGAAPMGLVEGCEWNFSWRQVLHPILQVHVRATKMTSSFSAAAAAGSLPTCSSCVIRVAGARGIARCEGAPPIGQMLGCEWQVC